MTTWPKRMKSVCKSMSSIVGQAHDEHVRFVLSLSKEEWDYDGTRPSLSNPHTILTKMNDLCVEVLWDEGNRRSHKKLMPVLEHYGQADVLVIDDDVIPEDGWLQAFIDDHRRNPRDIIYGTSSSRVEMVNGQILEGIAQRDLFLFPGMKTRNIKPANGANGTLYPSGTFTDPRFFDRSLYMRLSATSDETWNWAWAVMTGRSHRCLSSHNFPTVICEEQAYALSHTNILRYTDIHNAIAREFPLYKEKLYELINNKEL